MVHVSISIANDEIDNVGMAKGIKKRQEKTRKRKRDKSWVETSDRKTKRYSQKQRERSRVIFYVLVTTSLCLAYYMINYLIMINYFIYLLLYYAATSYNSRDTIKPS
jgi:hypothetical protein